MPRVKRGVTAHKRRERLLKHAKGFKWGRKNKEKAAREALMHAWSYAYRDRRVKKRDFRALWNIRINAAVRQEGMPYSKFIHALKEQNIALDRKILAQLAVQEPAVFKEIVQNVK
ncbi:MAG: 50S ribosomal protein L20 [Candidatus Portnoybacteria bacterium]|nr:50S ribosomal protein L20 [Candidatus Portnoybacteria bacterium]